MKAVVLDKLNRGVELARLLGIKSVSRVKDVPEDVGVVIRYGNREKLNRDGVIEINNWHALQITKDRRKLHRVLKENGVRNPYFEKLRWWTRFPVYVYDKRGSECGKGIVLVTSRSDIAELRRHGFEPAIFSKVLRVKHEYRVHVCRYSIGRNGFATLPYLKVPRKVRHDMFVLRNLAITNYVFRKVEDVKDEYGITDNEVSKACDIAIRAVRACGLDFAGVDVIINEKCRAWVIDVNSSPGIVKDGSKRFYAKNLGKLLAELGVELGAHK